MNLGQGQSVLLTFQFISQTIPNQAKTRYQLNNDRPLGARSNREYQRLEGEWRPFYIESTYLTGEILHRFFRKYTIKIPGRIEN